MFGAIARIVAKPVARLAVKAAPIVLKGAATVSTAGAAYQVGKAVLGAVKKPTSTGGIVPGAGGVPSYGLPPVPGLQAGTGARKAPLLPRSGSILGNPMKGPGGKMQLPFTGAEIPKMLEQFSLDDRYLTIGYRAPKGYVVIRDQDGKPFPVLREMAIRFGLWKPAKKPLLSIRDTNSLKRASHAIRKLKTATKQAKKIANFKGK